MNKVRGFTLVELIVVIAIIGVLAAVIAPNVFRTIEKGRIAATEADYRSIKTGAMAYFADVGAWPADGSTTGLTIDDGSAGWDGPYLEAWPNQNGWNGAYTWESDTGVNWDGVAGGDDARYITTASVPWDSAGRIDVDLDDGTWNAGSVQASAAYVSASGAVTMSMLVSR